jgi:hypothetical protein
MITPAPVAHVVRRCVHAVGEGVPKHRCGGVRRSSRDGQDQPDIGWFPLPTTRVWRWRR